MARRLIIAGIAGFWLTMMTLLIRREVVPAWVAAHRPTYRRADDADAAPHRTQMAILWGNERLGTYRSVTRRDTDGRLIMAGRASIDGLIPFLRIRTECEIANEVRVDADGRLEWCSVTVEAPGLRHVIASRVEGRQLVVTTGEGSEAETTVIDFNPRDMVTHDIAPLEGLGELAVGQSWYVTSLNPFTGGTSTALVQVTERQTIQWQARPEDTFVVMIGTGAGGVTLSAWVRPDGQVLRQQLPLGVILEREPYAEPPGKSGDSIGPLAPAWGRNPGMLSPDFPNGGTPRAAASRPRPPGGDS